MNICLLFIEIRIATPSNLSTSHVLVGHSPNTINFYIQFVNRTFVVVGSFVLQRVTDGNERVQWLDFIRSYKLWLNIEINIIWSKLLFLIIEGTQKIF